jgi:OmpA-OmpF porin, OOP family
MINKNQILLLLFNILLIKTSYSQHIDPYKYSSILDYQVKSIKGDRIEKIHYIDSVYYQASTQLKYIGEYIITRTNMVITDSTPINRWIFWNIIGELESIETYNKEGKINQAVNYLPISNNLIINPGFEFVEKNHIVGWSCIHQAQIKLYDIGQKGKIKSDGWILNISPPRTGNSYIELNLATTNPDFFVCPQFKSYRYIQGTLKERLIRGEDYYFEFYIKHNPCSKYSCNNLGIYFSEQPIHKEKEDVLELKPVFESKEIILADDWIKIQFRFKALEYYKYFIAGNFKNDKKTKISATNKVCEEVHGVYTTTANYFLDDFYLVNLKQKDITGTKQVKTKHDSLDYYIFDTFKVRLEKPILLENILFEFDSYKILPESATELNRLQSFLMNNENLTIEVSGYTDDIGDSTYNKVLSLKRAEAVCQYLINKGIDKSRVIPKGYGSNMALGPNNTEGGRTANRRVEFKIINR